MIMQEQQIVMGEFLNGKNLPLDLKVEILDHMKEQMNYKAEIEGKDFDVAFAEIKESWKADLKIIKPLFFGEWKTRILKRTALKTNIELFKKSGFYFIINLFLIFYNKTLAADFILSVYAAMVLIFVILSTIYFKLVKSIYKSDDRNISFFQRNSILLQISSVFILTLIIVDFDVRFDKYYYSVINLIKYGTFKPVTFVSIFVFNMYAFCWIYGFLYFLEYKKSIKFLEQKINFKL